MQYMGRASGGQARYYSDTSLRVAYSESYIAHVQPIPAPAELLFSSMSSQYASIKHDPHTVAPGQKDTVARPTGDLLLWLSLAAWREPSPCLSPPQEPRLADALHTSSDLKRHANRARPVPNPTKPDGANDGAPHGALTQQPLWTSARAQRRIQYISLLYLYISHASEWKSRSAPSAAFVRCFITP